MPTGFLCPRCKSRFSGNLSPEKKPAHCPVCGGELAVFGLMVPPTSGTARSQPVKPGRAPIPAQGRVGKHGAVIYWRAVAVAAGTAALFLLTLIYGVQVWAGGERTAAQEEITVPDELSSNLPIPLPEKAEGSLKGQPELKKEKPAPDKKNLAPPAPDPVGPQVAAAPARKVRDSDVLVGPPAPKASVKAKIEVKSSKAAFKHRNLRDDEELRRELILMPVFQENDVPAASRQLLASAPKIRRYTPETMPDFAGLPMRTGVDCQQGKEYAENLQALSHKLRSLLTAASLKVGQGPRAGIDPRPDPEQLRASLLGNQNAQELQSGGLPNEWLREEAVPTLLQLFMAENKPIRLLLVELLAKNRHKVASVALAQRALYDLSAEVREAAVTTLKDRPLEECRQILLQGFRYPWAPVADHAAEALIALEDREAVTALVNLLDKPDPAAPFKPEGSKRLVVREVVRINHLANCTLCHPRSVAETDLVRGSVPSPNQPLFTQPSGYGGTLGIFVRADVTYLRQDFSAFQPVPRPGQWPAHQRYDYVVRTRPQTLAEEIFSSPSETTSYGQRDTALFALRELTGKDLGQSTADWRQLLQDTDTFVGPLTTRGR